MRVGADSGGTFTDVVTDDGRITKVLSTPSDPGHAVGSAMDQLGVTSPELLSHGTTVATNALLEGNLARVALFTTDGFADVIEIGRQDRPSLYDPWVDRPPPLVERDDRLEVNERTIADGTVAIVADPGHLADPPAGTNSVAVSFLHSDLNPSNEQRIAEELRSRGWNVTASHEVSPEFREYERTVTAVINASLRPVCAPYLTGLAEKAEEVAVMTSAGSLVDVARAVNVPASLLLSGPAAGARAAAQVAGACGFADAVGFDMGGTSTDVCLILAGSPAVAAQQVVGGYPVRLPSLAVHTVGAGGGSIASLDSGGALVVGPRSAGAVPGPACYARGGIAPTVTDANLLAGHIPPGTAFSGLGELDRDAAVHAMDGAGVSPEGVLTVVNTTMTQALRKVSVEQGVDPAGLALVAFGGAGPLHACDLADELGTAVVIVPAMAGVLSAVGLITSPRGLELVRTMASPLDHSGIEDVADELRAEALDILLRAGDGGGNAGGALRKNNDVSVEVFLDCRYAGQSHDLRATSVTGFHDDHERINGFARRSDPVEVTAVRVRATMPAPTDMDTICAPAVGGWGRDPVVGPRVVTRDDCTVWVPTGWTGSEGPMGALILRREEDDHG